MNELAAATPADQLKERGVAAFRAGDLQSAEEAFHEAQQLYLSSGESAGQAEMLVNLGVVHIQTRQYEQSEKELNKALETFRALGLRSQEAQVLGNLGTLFERAGKKELSAAHYRQAVQLFEALGDKENQQATLGALTRLQVNEKQWIQSLFTYDAMLSSGRKLSLKQRFYRWLFKILAKLMKLH